MKITVELEIEDITNAMVLFEHVGEISTQDEGVKLAAYRAVPIGSPIVYAPDGQRRYMVNIQQIYSILAEHIMEGNLAE